MNEQNRFDEIARAVARTADANEELSRRELAKAILLGALGIGSMAISGKSAALPTGPDSCANVQIKYASKLRPCGAGRRFEIEEQVECWYNDAKNRYRTQLVDTFNCNTVCNGSTVAISTAFVKDVPIPKMDSEKQEVRNKLYLQGLKDLTPKVVEDLKQRCKSYCLSPSAQCDQVAKITEDTIGTWYPESDKPLDKPYFVRVSLQGSVTCQCSGPASPKSRT